MRKKVSTYKELFSKEACRALNIVCERYKGFITRAYKIMEAGDYIHWYFVVRTKSKEQTTIFPIEMERKHCEKALEELKNDGDCLDCLVFEDEERALDAFFK